MIDQHCIFQDFDDLVSVLFWKLLFIFALVNFTFSWSFPTNFFTTFPRLLKLVCKSWRSPLFRHILCTHRNNSLKWFSVLLFSFPLFFWILILVYFLNLTIACQFPCLWLFLFADFQYMLLYWILKFNLHSRPFSAINGSINYRCSVPLILIDDINIFFQLFKKLNQSRLHFLYPEY